MKDRKAIATVATTIELYPNKGLRAKTGMIVDATPKVGKIMMYTSGWPKNQNICWYNTGSPPPAASKKTGIKEPISQQHGNTTGKYRHHSNQQKCSN